MTDGPSEKKQVETDLDSDGPLRLADSNAGSTQPVPSDSDAEPLAPSRTGTGSGSSTPSPGGGTTGGFDTLLGQIVVRARLATQDEVDDCNTSLNEASASGAPGNLAEILVERDYVTRHQLDRLRQEFEAKKSSQRIPGYKIMKKLGSGAMATVFLAKQLSLDRLVAIKILPKRFSDNERFIERFYKEGRSAAQLNHPNIVSAYDVGQAGEHHYFVMEFVDGRTVHDRIAKYKRIAEKDAVEIVRQVAKALVHAHEKGFVHRDIKPKNIMITRQGVAKLADLGLARAMSDEEAARAEAGRAYGTPYYIAPEQIRGELNIGPAADIYGLGATLYHMVTGRVPFEGKNPSAVMHQHLKAELEPPDHVNPEISAGCAQVIEMMMAKKPRDRYHSASDVLEDLEMILAGQPPHFAHRTLDHVTITDALTDVVEAPPAIRQQDDLAEPRFMDSTAAMIIAGLLVLSVLVNIILLTFMLSG